MPFYVTPHFLRLLLPLFRLLLLLLLLSPSAHFKTRRSRERKKINTQHLAAGVVSNFSANSKQVESLLFSFGLPDRLISNAGAPLFSWLFIRSGPLSHGDEHAPSAHATQSYLEVIHIGEGAGGHLHGKCNMDYN